MLLVWSLFMVDMSGNYAVYKRAQNLPKKMFTCLRINSMLNPIPFQFNGNTDS